jgi:trigger factor
LGGLFYLSNSLSMQSTITRVSGHTVQILIKESGAELERAKKRTIEEARQHVQIKGFRKGASIPDEVILKEVGAAAILEQALEDVVNRAYRKILDKEKILPVGHAAIKEVKSYDPLEVLLEVEVLPEVTIDEKKMEKIKLKKTIVHLDEEKVMEVVRSIEGRHTTWAPKDSGAEIELGDRATIDTVGFDKKGGIEIPETKVKAFPLVIGSKNFIPGFEEKLVGSKAGDVVEFDITFPADYHADEFKSRKVFFMTTIFSIEKPVKPEWTPEFIEKVRGVKTDFEGFKQLIREEKYEEEDYKARAADEEQLLNALIPIAQVEVGPHLLANEVSRIFADHKKRIESYGYKMNQYLEHSKTTEEDYKKNVVEKEAERRIKAELILKKIREIKAVTVTDADMAREVENIMTRFHDSAVQDKIRAQLTPGQEYYEEVKSRLAYKLVVDSFFDQK